MRPSLRVEVDRPVRAGVGRRVGHRRAAAEEHVAAVLRPDDDKYGARVVVRAVKLHERTRLRRFVARGAEVDAGHSVQGILRVKPRVVPLRHRKAVVRLVVPAHPRAV